MNTNIKINNNALQCRSTVKYVGVRPDRKLTWIPKIKQTIDKIQSRTSKIYSFVVRNSKLNIKIKLVLYKTCILSITTDASVTRGQVCETNIKLIEAQWNKVIRIITRALLNKIKNTTITTTPKNQQKSRGLN